MTPKSLRYQVTCLVTLAVLLAGCAATNSGRDAGEEQMNATIRWTSYGIPHVSAEDWRGLGYGFGYAVAEDAVCVLAEVIVTVNGERSRYFGPGDGNLESDIFHRGLLDEAAIEHSRTGQPPQMTEMGEGYIAGFNRYLADHEGALPGSCNGKPWVRQMTRDDQARIGIGVSIRYGLGNFRDQIARATPPGEQVAQIDVPLPDLARDALGSNAYAFGKGVTKNARGILFGNPHYPWQGPSRFHLAHLMIPGEINMMGVGLYTTALIAIGFNENVAWSHTVSTGLRFTPYRLDLVPGDPMAYRYGDGVRRLLERPVTIAVKGDDGSIAQERHSIYMSHYGPVIAGRGMPWNREHVYTMRDVNLTNNRSAGQYLRMDRARSVEEIVTALSEEQGVAWTNTIAADRHGGALYADLSVVPNVSGELIERCRVGNHDHLGFLAEILLDGSDPGCEWREDPRSAAPGIMPPQELPKLITSQYVTNSNDSYWLSNPVERLEGYSPIIGNERAARSLRTRAGLKFVEEVLGPGGEGRFSPDTVQQIIYSHRNYGAELLLDDVLAICGERGEPVQLENALVDLGPACRTLAAWDRRQGLESRGAQIYTEFWRNAAGIEGLYAVPFDVDDPVHTPRGIDGGSATVRQAVLEALARAVRTLEENDVALDAPWGEVQYVERNGDRIGIPGGAGGVGMFSVISAPLQKGGYTPVVSGNSYIQVVTWDDEGNPDARAILTYSQSQEPESPHYADQTKLYSQGGWIRLPFTEAQIEADVVKRIELSGGE